MLRKLSSIDPPVSDDLGGLPQRAEASEVPGYVIPECYECRPLGFTSNPLR